MSETYEARGDRHLSSPDAAWAAYRQVIDRMARELGDLESRMSWVKASDGSVTPGRETLDGAVAVLEADGLPFTYSFTSLTSKHGDVVAVYVWTNQRRVMVTSRATSASRAKGLAAVGTDLLEAIGGPRDVSVARRPGFTIVSGAVEDERRRTPKWVIWVSTVAGGAILTGAVAFGYAYLTAWMKSSGLMP
ncbi:hypothetical protein ABS642_05140 [Microbacterium sp. A8/3-1]|uniref:Uncharacterized protein n=1 Tax=Microbacterium sp. A8/3-1 TaxID=3160749 RepID=A0AAU7W0H7_9MICO